MDRRLKRRRLALSQCQNRPIINDSLDLCINAKLESVLGCTANNASSVAVDENSGIIAYPAGSTVVLYNGKTHQQCHLLGVSKNTITCLDFSKDGRHLVTGEYGLDPCVRVWEMHDKNWQWQGVEIIRLKSHQLGIVCVRFSPIDQQVISVGNQCDKSILVWDWKTGSKVAENRLTNQVLAMAVSAKAEVVTVGVRHVKFWYTTMATSGENGACCRPLQGRSAILSSQRNNTFVGVVCGPNDRTFAVTETKLLVEFNDKKLVCSYDLHSTTPYSIAIGFDRLFIGCADGIIRVMSLNPITHLMALAKPHYLGVDVAQGHSPDHLFNQPRNAQYPAVLAVRYQEKTATLTAFYSDRSIYQWNFATEGKIGKISSQLFHSGGPVYGLEMYPENGVHLPQNSFLTCGSDETVRIWNIDLDSADHFDGHLPRKNIYSRELLKIVYFGRDLQTVLCQSPEKGIKGWDGREDGQNFGVKTLKISPDGRHLATGTKDGNIKIFDISEPGFSELASFEAHDSDVLTLEFSNSGIANSRCYVLASGGRDRLVHIFDPLADYCHLATVDDHSSAIMAIKFIKTDSDLSMVTCSADKLMFIRKLASNSNFVRFEKAKQIAVHSGAGDLQVLPSELLSALCQDKHLRTYTASGKLVNSVKCAGKEEGVFSKLVVDRSGTLAATVCSDKSVYLFELSSGELTTVLPFQSDLITQVAFSNDSRRLLVVSCNGCIFIWRLSSHLTQKIYCKLENDTKERASSPDSVLESETDLNCQQFPSGTTFESFRGEGDGATNKDSESEFGSLTNIQMDQRVPPNDDIQRVISDDFQDYSQFEVKKLPSEVIRRSNSGLIKDQSWNISNSNDDLSDENANKSTLSNASKSMSNLGDNDAIFSPTSTIRNSSIVSNESAAKLSNFDRNSSERISLTQKYLRETPQKCADNDKTNTIWKPRERNNFDKNPNRRGSELPLKSPEDANVEMRAKTLNRLRNRRMSATSCANFPDELDNARDSASCSSRKDSELLHQGSTLARMNRVRERLRQSQENLHQSLESSSQWTQIARSKSIGNVSPNTSNKYSSTSLVTPSVPKSLIRTQMLTKSTGNLNGDPVNCGRLSDTILQLKKSSNHDLTNEKNYKDVNYRENDQQVNRYYGGNSLSRRKGGVQRKVERYQPRISASITGDNDGHYSDGNYPSFAVRTRRYISTGSNRSSSSMEASGVRRQFESTPKMSGLAAMHEKRTSNYLGNTVGGSEMCSDSDSFNRSIFEDFRSRDSNTKQMADHLTDCLKQLNTGLDKILQARKMLESDSALSSADRQQLMSLLNCGLNQARKRLDSPTTNNLCVQSESEAFPKDAGPNSDACTTTCNTKMDETVDQQFLIRHGNELIALLRKNMAKQN